MNMKTWKADRRKKEQYISVRISTDGTRIVLWDGGSDYPPTIADLIPLRAEDGKLYELLIESNEPEVVDLDEVYKHFRRQEMTHEELWRELTWVDPVREYRRKIASLAPNQKEILNAASETVPMRGEALITKAGHEYSGQTKECVTVLGKKLGLLKKVPGGFVRQLRPRSPYA